MGKGYNTSVNITSLDLSFLSYDALLLVGVVAAFAFITYRFGMNALLSALFALLSAPVLVALARNAYLLGGTSSVPDLYALIVGFALAFVLFSRMLPGAMFGDGGHLGQAVVAAIAASSAALALWASVPALSSVFPVPTPLAPWFGAPYTFWWLLCSFVLLGFARRQSRFLW